MPRIRELFFYFALGMLLNSVLAADLSLPSPLTGPGTSALISLTFATGNDGIGGLQFDLQYDPTVMTLMTTPGDALRGSGKSIYVQDLAPNLRRFLIIGPNRNAIPGGVLLNLFINVSTNAANGTYALNIANFSSTDISGNAIPTSTASGSISIQGNTGSRIVASGVVNSASLAPGPVAPGEVITLIGSGIGPAIAVQPASSATSIVLGGTSVLFDSTPAPLLYAGPNQINAIVPYGISSQDLTQMLIVAGETIVGGLSLPVSPAAPAVFTLAGSGVGPGVILNQDLTVNSPANPADRGSVVVLYATGAGSMSPVPVDGQVTGDPPPVPNSPVSVQIGGADAQIRYAGAAPALVAGVLQVNCVVPENIDLGNSVPVVLMVGTTPSPAGAVLAVR